MSSIVFETEITGAVIEIPAEYRGKFVSTVQVAITELPRRPVETTGEAFRRAVPPVIMPRRRSGPVTESDFSPPHIHTRGWKFNREEANER
ncbi:hypothetical protein AGMMS49959_19440 [Planctomycetales bacterium]|nr:hypothetical protein AGMMS49959_19440 [Planctomycetales bacterium]